MMLKTPVMLIVFNRLQTTREVFGRIREARPERLFVAADGPRAAKSGEEARCREVRDFVTGSVDWPCEVRTLFRNENLGCKYAVSGAVKWFFENVEAGIVLEDDCLPSRSFFGFCERLLERYRDDPRVGMISGHNYFGKTEEGARDYSFITTCGVWGWASWKRALRGYDPDLLLEANDRASMKSSICVRKATYRVLVGNSNDSARNEISTWDYQFCVHLIRNGMYTIMPSVNLIRNLGFSEDSTHTSVPPSWYIDRSYDIDHELRIAGDVRVDKKLSSRIESFHLPRKRGPVRLVKAALRKPYSIMFKSKTSGNRG
jgi:hypothetical protein